MVRPKLDQLDWLLRLCTWPLMPFLWCGHSWPAYLRMILVSSVFWSSSLVTRVILSRKVSTSASVRVLVLHGGTRELCSKNVLQVSATSPWGYNKERLIVAYLVSWLPPKEKKDLVNRVSFSLQFQWQWLISQHNYMLCNLKDQKEPHFMWQKMSLGTPHPILYRCERVWQSTNSDLAIVRCCHGFC